MAVHDHHDPPDNVQPNRHEPLLAVGGRVLCGQRVGIEQDGFGIRKAHAVLSKSERGFMGIPDDAHICMVCILSSVVKSTVSVRLTPALQPRRLMIAPPAVGRSPPRFVPRFAGNGPAGLAHIEASVQSRIAAALAVEKDRTSSDRRPSSLARPQNSRAAMRASSQTSRVSEVARGKAKVLGGTWPSANGA